MSPDSKGSINPWDLSGERHEKPKWNEEGGYKTPFAAISSFLELWPGDEQTSECDIPERHLRLIETIAGYPEILVGRRPLDMPLHPRSKLAFELSNFLDKIQSPFRKSEWHSLRSFLLHADLKIFTNKDNSEKDHHAKFLHILLKTIREESEFDSHEDLTDTLHQDEHQLLTALHSKDKIRVEEFWPLGEANGIKFKKMNPNINLQINNMSSEETRGSNYIEHTFRLSKIHSWIEKWSDTEIINPNTSHHLSIGSSAFLESVIAKMRSKILDEKRPGSIIVDGGGKITFISTKSKEDEENWMKIHLTDILMKDSSPEKEGRNNTHPFQKVIQKNIKQYGEMVDEERGNYYRSKGVHSISPHFQFRNLADQKNPDGIRVKVPQSDLYKDYIGPDVIKYFLPPISINKSEDEEPKWLLKESINSLEGDKENLPWTLGKCLVCKNVREFDLKCQKCNKLTKHQVEFGKSICFECKTQPNLGSPLSILKRRGFVCQFHHLIHEIGKRTIIRQTSFLTNSGKDINSKKDLKIQHIIIFDGNSIGKIFTIPLKKLDDSSLEPIEDTAGEIWRNFQTEIIDINNPWNTCTKLTHELNNIADEGLRRKVTSILSNRRLQTLIRKQRRSFSFNVGWWVSIASSISKNINLKGKAITPWILAGDDTVLASHSEDENDIQELLTTFQNELQNQFPKVPISFAGSVQSRGDLTIQECYRKASDLEKIASNAWKHQIGIENDLLTEQKVQELKHLEKDKGEEWKRIIDSAKWATENGKLIGEKEVKSLILFDNWNNHSSS